MAMLSEWRREPCGVLHSASVSTRSLLRGGEQTLALVKLRLTKDSMEK